MTRFKKAASRKPEDWQSRFSLLADHAGDPRIKAFYQKGGIAGSTRLEDILAPLLQAMTGRVMVAHYSRLEQEFLGRTVSDLTGDFLAFPVVDTMELESRKHPVFRPNFIQRWMGEKDSPSLRLAHARERYNLPPYRPHHALTDALAAAELFMAQVADQFTPDTPVSDLMYHQPLKG